MVILFYAVSLIRASTNYTATYGAELGLTCTSHSFPPQDDVEVSPVDEIPDVSMLQLNRPQPTSHPRQAASNIPTLRRERRRNNLAPKNDTRNKSRTKPVTPVTQWDTLTGEPTTGDRGRPQQVRPSEFMPPGTIQGGDGGGGPASRQAGPRTQASFGDRVRKQRENTIADRPEWKGSSGRTAIVPVVTDQPDMSVLGVSRKMVKRAESPRVGVSGTRGAPVFVLEAGIDETAVASQPTPSYAPRTTGTPVAPMATSRSSSRGRDAPNSTGAPLALTDPRALSPDNYTTKPLPPPGQDDPRTTPDDRRALKRREESTSTIEQHFRDALKDLNIPTPIKDQPVSRFSISTYATTAAESTPRVSIDQSPSPQQSPLLHRSRPRAGGNFDASKATMRKAVPNAPVFINMPSESRRTSKTLPKSPAEAASVDLVSSLQAQLDNLAHQRRNLQRCIHQMTELMPIDMLARGMEAQRQAAERQKVEVLKEDLAEVIREEHELGLRLHRAYKRMDDEAVYEPTTLWVRRVTG